MLSLRELIGYFVTSEKLNIDIDYIAGAEEYRLFFKVIDSARPYIVSLIYEKISDPVLLVASDFEKATKYYHLLKYWLPQNADIKYFPLFLSDNGQHVNLDDLCLRVSALHSIMQYSEQNSKTPLSSLLPPIVISCVSALSERIISPVNFKKCTISIASGVEIDMHYLIKKLLKIGYKNDSIVEIPGTFCKRGGIVDVFPYNNVSPLRLEFDGNLLVSIREFDPKTQRSQKIKETAVICPSTEMDLDPKDNVLLDYLSDSSIIIVDEPIYTLERNSVNRAVIEVGNVELAQEVSNNLDENREINEKKLKDRIERFQKVINIGTWFMDNGTAENMFFVPINPVSKLSGQMDDIVAYLRKQIEQEHAIVICTQQKERLLEVLNEKNIPVYSAESLMADEMPVKGSVGILKIALNEGWSCDPDFILLSDYELFGWVRMERASKTRSVRYSIYRGQLKSGDYVVHIDHGIGIFRGFVKIGGTGSAKEYLLIEYAGNDKLYVPIDQVHRVGIYIGSNGQQPSLSRLHTQEWSQTKIRIKKAIRDVAEDLLNLYAKRALIKGFSFSPDNLWQKELESSFPYVETEDQLKALAEVKRDMESDKPMDRLICGDVGYGKTEIALRSAFKAVMDGKQVIVLVPTTILAQQHYLTFINRLYPFPVKVAVLSRFVSSKREREILEGLARGTIDICVGTHRLLQPDVVIKNLGLIIIDEEQRFGVIHKEYFRRRYAEVDVLTLSATPIPRTMYMSLTGIKDMSLLETPPENRLPVKSYIGPYDSGIVRQAIIHELKRRGQVFYVHNRINNIYAIAANLSALVPEALITVAHARMTENELEKVMIDFVEHKFDVLVTTTIIESGVDIPNVNTLIVNDCDRFGLTQLYQLRGRIGRGINDAFAYFFYRRPDKLTPEAKKRLSVIAEATELGAGYYIAMKDLEIRGAGNLLGTQQSGNISAVGFDLYCRLLAETIEEMRMDKIEDKKRRNELNDKNIDEITINLPFKAFIPETYIDDLNIRLSFYQMIASARTDEDLQRVIDELLDRFGKLPEEVENLIFVVRIKRLALEAGITSIDHKDGYIIIFSKHRIEMQPKELEDLNFQSVILGRSQIKIPFSSHQNRWKLVLFELLQRLRLLRRPVNLIVN